MKKAPSGAFFISRGGLTQSMGSLHTHALFPHGTGPYSAHWSEEAHAAPSAGKIRAPCMIPGPSARKRPGKIRAPCMIPRPSTQKCRLPDNIRALCIRNRPIASRNGYTGRRSCHPQLEKNAFRADVAREAPLFAQSAKRGCIAREYCHISQNNLMDTTKQWADVAPA